MSLTLALTPPLLPAQILHPCPVIYLLHCCLSRCCLTEEVGGRWGAPRLPFEPLLSCRLKPLCPLCPAVHRQAGGQHTAQWSREQSEQKSDIHCVMSLKSMLSSYTALQILGAAMCALRF